MIQTDSTSAWQTKPKPTIHQAEFARAGTELRERFMSCSPAQTWADFALWDMASVVSTETYVDRRQILFKIEDCLRTLTSAETDSDKSQRKVTVNYRQFHSASTVLISSSMSGSQPTNPTREFRLQMANAVHNLFYDELDLAYSALLKAQRAVKTI